MLVSHMGLIISASLSIFLSRSDYGIILSFLIGASHLVVTAAFSFVAALATALPTQSGWGFHRFQRGYSTEITL